MPNCPKCSFEPPDSRARFCPSCGAMLGGPTDPSDPLIGSVVGDRFLVTGLLGQGGMGRVYRAEQKMGTISRKVALKTLHPDLASDPAVAQRFNREAETVIGLSHPNTITFHDFGQTPDGTLFIVMELIEGSSLAEALRDGPFPPERVEHILAQVCGSLHEAHELGVIHRDLKPENIFLSERAGQPDFVKVLDFGIAKRTELDTDSIRLTKAGFVLGTPPYMSPEQFTGQKLDRRSDIYSLGVMTYEMLTGELPFHAKTPWEWATQHMSVEPAPLESSPPGRLLPESCRQAVLRALAKQPDARPSTALAFFDEFSGATPSTLGALITTSKATRLPLGTLSRDGSPSGPTHEDDDPWTEGSGSSRAGLRLVLGLAAALAALGATATLLAHLGFLPVGGDGGRPWTRAEGAEHANEAGLPPEETLGGGGGNGTTPNETDGDGGRGASTRDADARVADAGSPAAAPPERLDPAAAATVEQLDAALRRGDVDAALELLPVVEQLAGRRSLAARTAKSTLAGAVFTKVGLALMQGDCRRASELYRRAARVGVERRAREQFTAAWCPVPE